MLDVNSHAASSKIVLGNATFKQKATLSLHGANNCVANDSPDLVVGQLDVVISEQDDNSVLLVSKKLPQGLEDPFVSDGDFTGLFTAASSAELSFLAIIDGR